ncbi:MAG: S9 family peptidase [Chloroflexi bacterium]|nr:S9 family peptidase [Chloroflexota bacterium]
MAERRGYQIEDLFRLKTVGDPQISPDGKGIAYAVTEIDQKSDGYRSAIWLAEEGSQPRQLTFGGRSDSQPRWSSDGRYLAFFSNRAGGANQLHLLPLAGGEAYRLTDLPRGVFEFAWSPKSDAIAFTSRTGGAQASNDRTPPRVITTFRHKQNGQGFFDGSRLHLFVVGLEGDQPKQLTDGDWDDAQIAWSPDGGAIAFISARHERRDWDSAEDLWTVSVKGGEVRQLTNRLGALAAPAFSPDGKTIAFAGVGDPEDTAGRNSRLWVIPFQGGQPRDLSGPLGRAILAAPLSPGAPPSPVQWTSDGRSILARVHDGADIHLYRFSVRDGAATRILGGQRCVMGFSAAPNGALACLITDHTHPAEVYRTDLRGSEEVKVSSANDELLSDLRFPEIEAVRVPLPDGAAIEGWVIKPLDMEQGKKYPLALDIHGGPHAAFQHQFQGAYPLALSTRGCGVLQMNPRGSTGWGEEFARSLHGGRGERDFPELMASIDQVIRQGWVDPDRLGVTGYSYGGYMTGWAVTHTDRFNAAVWGAGVSNLYTMFMHTDSTIQRYAENGGDPWKMREQYLRLSPISYVQNARTPILLMHGEADLRCNTIQSDEFFTALRYHGVEAVLVRYPGEHHGFRQQGKPTNRLDYDQRLVAWFAERLGLKKTLAT